MIAFGRLRRGRGPACPSFCAEPAPSAPSAFYAERPSDQLGEVIGTIHSGGGRARRSGGAFGELLAKDRGPG